MLLKQALRAEVKEKIARLSEAYITESDDAVSKKLLSHDKYLAAERVFVYYSIGREVSTRFIAETATRSGKSVCYPVVLPRGVMFFAAVPKDRENSGDFLSEEYYGIPCPPKNSTPVTAAADDVIIVPALCYDRRGFRLGHGGGYYDRYLSSCFAYKIGLCRSILLIDELPRETHDVPVDEVIYG